MMDYRKVKYNPKSVHDYKVGDEYIQLLIDEDNKQSGLRDLRIFALRGIVQSIDKGWATLEIDAYAMRFDKSGLREDGEACIVPYLKDGE